MQKIWICGANGRVGQKMKKLLEDQPVELLLTDIDSVDITAAGDVMEYAGINRPHFIVNCAGLTDLAQCGRDREMAFKVNALGARNLSVAARMGKARLVQCSTDDVFGSGSRIPYTEFDAADPQTVYGKSKLAGENFVREFCSRYDFAREAVRLSGFCAPVVPAGPGEDMLSAMRPSCSVLDNMMLRMSGIALLPDWREMLKGFMAPWREKHQKGQWHQ